MGVVFGWLRLASGSVWAPTLAHGAINSVAGLPIVLLTPHDSALGGMLTSLTGWLVLGLFIAWLLSTRRVPVPLESGGPATDEEEAAGARRLSLLTTSSQQGTE